MKRNIIVTTGIAVVGRPTTHHGVDLGTIQNVLTSPQTGFDDLPTYVGTHNAHQKKKYKGNQIIAGI